jgi:hypothetical protein
MHSRFELITPGASTEHPLLDEKAKMEWRPGVECRSQQRLKQIASTSQWASDTGGRQRMTLMVQMDELKLNERFHSESPR